MKTRGAGRQSGFSLVELLVAMAIGLTVMSGVIQVLVASKSNFISERELAALQENARFAVKFISDEVRMAGFQGCSATPLSTANSLNGSSGNWFLDGTGLQGFEHESGILSFPVEFRSEVAANTDAIVVRRGEHSGLVVAGNHNFNAANLPLNKQHSIKPGEILVMASGDCQQVAVFQVSGPTNASNNATNIVHNTGTGTPGNCTKFLGGNFNCNTAGSAVGLSFPKGSAVMRLHSEAFYVGASTADSSIPALFHEVLGLTGTTASTRSEELVQGVELMQILYGLDGNGDRRADRYLKADAALMDWSAVVSVRLFLRLRSLQPVYNNAEAFGTFQDIPGTDGADRYLRQVVTTTIQIRNG
ncbi:MAG: PilW family protein [Pseudomonadales bacterium]|nr:PilW family protein [Pseudomonadales bacterium]